MLPTASNYKPCRSILHPLEFISEILECCCKQGVTIVQSEETKAEISVLVASQERC